MTALSGTHFVLTRYLYDKQKVNDSLDKAIADHDYTQSCFWAYELYFSGFQKETLDQLWQFYKTRFSKNHPKLGIYIQQKYKSKSKEPELVATIIKNLTMKNPDIQQPQCVKFVNVKAHHIDVFRTKEPADDLPPWKFLREICSYGVIGYTDEARLKAFRENWLNHAVKSPIWANLIELYGGSLKDDSVVFADDDAQEAFYNRFGYEPDELPLEIQQRCIGNLYDNTI